MSRRRNEEVNFGSDSFLDIVANLVGILIILIVIAGLRLSQTPVPSSESEVKSAPITLAVSPPIVTAKEPDDPPIEPLFAAEEGEENLAPPAPISRKPSSPRELSVLEPPRKLVAQADKLQADVQRQEQAFRAAGAKTAELRRLEADLQERLTQLQKQAESKQRVADSAAQEQLHRRTTVEQLQAALAQLRQQIAAEIRKAPPVETLEHQVAPISKVVEGHEQHYRLAGNRVSEVPVASLSIRLKDQIERRKDWLIKQRSSQGQVGPICGYTMHYLVQKDQLGVLDEVRYGQNVVRISVANWRIEPERDLETESADEALRQGSRFYESLLTADEGTTLTFWVYPDSYEIYRKLQRFAHNQGFLVAGRPLPHGIPISGSPAGSKSAGQ